MNCRTPVTVPQKGDTVTHPATTNPQASDVVGNRDNAVVPRVLLLYYSYTGQTLKVLEAVGEVFGGRGYDVRKAAIEFTDRRYSGPFSRFPMRRVWPDMLSVLPAQTRRATGEIRMPGEVGEGDYDLICIGSPTWWDTASMPLRSFLESDKARQLLAGLLRCLWCVAEIGEEIPRTCVNSRSGKAAGSWGSPTSLIREIS